MTSLPTEKRAVPAGILRAVRSLELRATDPDRIDLLERSPKSMVLRVTWLRPRARRVVLKGCDPASAELEATLHTEVLPRIPVGAPRLFGVWGDGEVTWLAMEDMGDESPSLEDDRQRAMVSRWIGELHAASRELNDLASLPSRGARHYAGRLESARVRLAERWDAKRGEDERSCLARAMHLCSALRLHWEAVEEGAERLPPAFVHADLAPENLRLVGPGRRLGVAAIDWEKAGFGRPCADLAIADPAEYAAASGASLEAVASSMWVARLFGALSHNWAAKPISEVDRYGRRLERALGAIDGL